jgi:hypothetical protein
MVVKSARKSIFSRRRLKKYGMDPTDIFCAKEYSVDYQVEFR